MIYQETVKVLWNTKVGPSYFRMGFTCHEGYSNATPGQFVMLRFPGQMTPFLRRPFSIHKLIPQKDRTLAVELLYKVVGEGTLKLSARKKGDILDLIGPLGNGFSFSDHFQRVFIVAGGIGVAPMSFLASYLQTKGIDLSKCSVFIGGRSKDDLLCRDDFSRLGMKVHFTTDDGSQGDQCLVTHPLDMASRKRRPDVIYACGPLEMLRCVTGIADNLNIPCQVSVETIMACGVGACLGCAVEKKETPANYLHACLDGPVFESGAIKI